MHCGYHVKEDSVSLAIVRFEIRDLGPHQVRSIHPVSQMFRNISPSLSGRTCDKMPPVYLDSGVGHIGGGAGQGRLGGADGEEVVNTGWAPRPHRVGGPADQCAKIHFILRRVLNNAFCVGNGNIRILIV